MTIKAIGFGPTVSLEQINAKHHAENDARRSATEALELKVKAAVASAFQSSSLDLTAVEPVAPTKADETVPAVLITSTSVDAAEATDEVELDPVLEGDKDDGSDEAADEPEVKDEPAPKKVAPKKTKR